VLGWLVVVGWCTKGSIRFVFSMPFVSVVVAFPSSPSFPYFFFATLSLTFIFCVCVCVCVCGFECVSFLFQKMDGYRLFLVYNRRTERALSREFWIKTNRSFSLSRSLSLSVFSFTDRVIYLHLANRHPIQNARSQSTIYAKQKKKKKKRRKRMGQQQRDVCGVT
jgi:hypothetical protein